MSKILRPHIVMTSLVSAGLVALAWIVASGWIYPTSPLHPISWLTVILLAGFYFIGEAMPVALISQGHRRAMMMTFSGGFSFALLTVAPMYVAFLVQLAVVLAQEIRWRPSRLRFIVNSAQTSLSIAIAGTTFHLLSGKTYLSSGVLTWRDILGLGGAAIPYVFVNLGVITLVMASQTGKSFRSALTELNFRSRFLPYSLDLALAPMSLAMVHYSAWLLPVLLLPPLALRKSADLALRREHEATHDVLTGLPNRSLLPHAFAELHQSVIHGEAELAVMLIDLDHFKEINDTLGHHVGDLLLCEVAKRIREAVREDDIASRLGGDEFAVMAPFHPGQSRMDALELAERVVKALEPPFCTSDVQIDVQASVGIALAPEHGVDIEALMAKADTALYHAKIQRGCAAIYQSKEDEKAERRVELLGALQEGFEVGAVEVYYEPVVETSSNAMRSAEVSLRWTDPGLGSVNPLKAIPMLDKTSLIVPLTYYAITESVKSFSQLAAKRGEESMPALAVTVGVRLLSDNTFPMWLNKLLTSYEFPAHKLIVQMTEETLVSDISRTSVIMAQLSQLGITLGVVGYGKGVTSLEFFHRVGVRQVSVDPALFHEADDATLRATVDYGHALGLVIIATGVTEERDLELWNGLGVNFIQGGLAGDPHPRLDHYGLINSPSATYGQS